MKRKQIKFVAGSVAIVLILTYLGYSGFEASKSYYETVSELYASKDAAYNRQLKVAGDVVPGSIHDGRSDGSGYKFVISQVDDKTKETQTLRVNYVGTDPLPDTFRDRAQAVVEGKYGHDGIFVAQKMQAKCASKYEKEAAAGVTQTSSGTGAPSKTPAASSSEY
jgi:cytochrome c-type biogenesis protein CcmE